MVQLECRAHRNARDAGRGQTEKGHVGVPCLEFKLYPEAILCVNLGARGHRGQCWKQKAHLEQIPRIQSRETGKAWLI